MINLEKLIAEAFSTLISAGDLPEAQAETPYTVTPPTREGFGDFTTNAAMVRARDFKMAPKKIAEQLGEKLKENDAIQSVDVAGPGFLNITMVETFWHDKLINILTNENDLSVLYKNVKNPQKILVEFISANPTGPMHFGHGRGAIVGDVLCNILAAYGHAVTREYYVNDAGNQMNNLGETAKVRYKQAVDGNFDNEEVPEGGYPGQYLIDIGKELLEEDGGFQDHDLEWFKENAKEKNLDLIRNTLDRVGIRFDNWFSEKSLYETGRIDTILEELKKTGVLYEKDGAWWLNTSRYKDEKDRVVVKSDGEKTYFASDIVYHKEKFERGYDLLINIMGADHHGYIERLKAAVQLEGYKAEQLKVILVKLVNLKKSGEMLKMSKRGDTFITIDDVVDEVGKDAARFTFLTRSADSALDFDIDVAAAESKENPVFYTQYAYARINSLFNKAEERGVKIDNDANLDLLAALKADEEISLIKAIDMYPSIIERSAEKCEPHNLTYYILDLSAKLHKFYYSHKVLDSEPELLQARLFLLKGVQAVLKDGLSLLGVSTPERM